MPKSPSDSSKTTQASNMPNLKQGTLSFASTKRTSSTRNVKLQKKKTLATERGGKKQVEISADGQSDAKPVEISGEDAEGVATAEITVPVKRARASTEVQPSPGITKQAPSPLSQKKEPLDVEDKAGRYRKYYHEVRSKMGHMEPIHSEGQNKIHQMLRFFDMSYEFGPCIGMTRLERWERAKTFGLDPPVEIRDILLSKEGVEKAEYAQCVLHGEV